MLICLIDWSGIKWDLYTDQPGIVVYSCHWMGGKSCPLPFPSYVGSESCATSANYLSQVATNSKPLKEAKPRTASLEKMDVWQLSRKIGLMVLTILNGTAHNTRSMLQACLLSQAISSISSARSRK